MRLADFIRTEIEPILQDWEAFAKTILSAKHMSKTGLRDHARHMLLEIADDIDTPQSETEQAAKSKGCASAGEESWAEVHGGDRQTSGFTVIETVSEFRALRASVVAHWTKSYKTIPFDHLEDLTRFHEAIDQAVAESLEQYATLKEMETRLFGAVLLASPDPIYVLDLEGKFIYANKATADLFALAPEEIMGKSTFDLGFPFAADFQHNIEKVIAEQSTYRGKFVHTFSSGLGERFEYLLAPVLDEQQKTEATVCISRDITEQALAEEKIWHNAHHDLLTGLPNRRLFLDRLEQELKHANRSNLSLAVLFLDLDGFKGVNDTLGHEAGDRVLQLVAERLTNCVREEDTVARLGGDEFTVILIGAEQQQDIEVVAQTIIDAIALPFDLEKKSVQISASIGISLFTENTISAVEMLEAADHAMYSAKKSSTNRIYFYDTSEQPEIE
ncbi:diguanylate cyclase domain-containing protein [Methylophaga muralis]|uniref:Cyclic di-GMP phosphodiesterase Gmr n=1 Tax=Methylophaga muralis TaxID=291169 RepID=A0A1E3GNW8_9GAMM|nr:diguanylate cyclase [Methylophaga muralis]ODN65753.1 Cyclic di-GMP phosphodiesterase Gmr [Methylophaga muralis]